MTDEMRDLLRDLARAKAEAQLRAIRAALSSSPVAVSIAPETDAKPQGRWCWACLRHEVQADGWCRKCGGMTGQPQEKGE